jgi:hypothetical protein
MFPARKSEEQIRLNLFQNLNSANREIFLVEGKSEIRESSKLAQLEMLVSRFGIYVSQTCRHDRLYFRKCYAKIISRICY